RVWARGLGMLHVLDAILLHFHSAIQLGVAISGPRHLELSHFRPNIGEKVPPNGKGGGSRRSIPNINRIQTRNIIYETIATLSFTCAYPHRSPPFHPGRPPGVAPGPRSSFGS